MPLAAAEGASHAVPQRYRTGRAVSEGRTRMVVRAPDGVQVELGPGDAFEAPPGHDAWVVGEEPCVALDFVASSKQSGGLGGVGASCDQPRTASSASISRSTRLSGPGNTGGPGQVGDWAGSTFMMMTDLRAVSVDARRSYARRTAVRASSLLSLRSLTSAPRRRGAAGPAPRGQMRWWRFRASRGRGAIGARARGALDAEPPGKLGLGARDRVDPAAERAGGELS